MASLDELRIIYTYMLKKRPRTFGMASFVRLVTKEARRARTNALLSISLARRASAPLLQFNPAPSSELL